MNSSEPDLAFLFPGQGSQFVGMGSDIWSIESARAIFDQADAVLGFPLSDLMLKGPQEELRQTENAQPAILAVSLAYHRVMQEFLGENMPHPKFVAGHSLGEYTAMVVAGAISPEEAFRLVRIRAQLMQTASSQNPSGMAAIIGFDKNKAVQVCAETGVQLANINTTEQLVIAGAETALQEAIRVFKERGARRVVTLEVSGAFHSEIMRPVQDQLAMEIEKTLIHEASIPIIANTTAEPIRTPEEIRLELSRQLCGCVLWQESIEYMLKSGVMSLIEIGPGKVLSGLVRRIDTQVEIMTLGHLDVITSLTLS